MFMSKKKKSNLPEEKQEEQNASANEIQQETDAPVSDEAGDDAEPEPEAEEAAPVDEKSIASHVDEALEEWLSERELDESIVTSIRNAVAMVISAAREDCTDQSLFDILHRGVDYDRAVSEAAAQGEIRGRNARIEELIKEETDGVPHPQGAGFNPMKAQSIFDLARGAY